MSVNLKTYYYELLITDRKGFEFEVKDYCKASRLYQILCNKFNSVFKLALSVGRMGDRVHISFVIKDGGCKRYTNRQVGEGGIN